MNRRTYSIMHRYQSPQPSGFRGTLSQVREEIESQAKYYENHGWNVRRITPDYVSAINGDNRVIFETFGA